MRTIMIRIYDGSPLSLTLTVCLSYYVLLEEKGRCNSRSIYSQKAICVHILGLVLLVVIVLASRTYNNSVADFKFMCSSQSGLLSSGGGRCHSAMFFNANIRTLSLSASLLCLSGPRDDKFMEIMRTWHKGNVPTLLLFLSFFSSIISPSALTFIFLYKKGVLGRNHK